MAVTAKKHKMQLNGVADTKFVHNCETRDGAGRKGVPHTHPSLQPEGVHPTQLPLPTASEGGKGPGKVTQSMTSPKAGSALLWPR